MPSSDWRPHQNRMLAASGSASKSPASTTCQSRPPTSSSTKRAVATACSSRSSSKSSWKLGRLLTNSSGPTGAGAWTSAASVTQGKPAVLG
jgi:hypothetical protein